MRAELAADRARREAQSKKDAEPHWNPTEVREFRALFPGVALEDLPDAVLRHTRAGIPLAAAYALEEKRDEVASAAAEASNARAGTQSPGSLRGQTEGFFSPDEVRAMSRHEIRDHMAQIRESMKRWNG